MQNLKTRASAVSQISLGPPKFTRSSTITEGLCNALC